MCGSFGLTALIQILQAALEFVSNGMNNVSLCLIVKNEERYLAACLDSAFAAVDEVIVVDTGSSDATVSIARARGAKVFDFKWCGDFSAARNASLSHATGDWILVLDADERLSQTGARKIRQISAQSEFDACLLQIRSPYHFTKSAQRISTVLSIRFFRNRSDLRYAGKLHESVDAKAGGLSIGIADIIIDHFGYMGDVSEKYRRNYEITDAPEQLNAFARFDLARRDLAFGQADEATNSLRRQLSDATMQPWLKAQVHLAIGDTEASRSNLEAAVSAWRSAAEIDPALAAPHLRLAITRYKDSDYAQSLNHFRELISRLDRGAMRGALIDDEIPLREAHTWATACCLELGLKQQAEEHISAFEKIRAQEQEEDTRARIIPFKWLKP